MAHKSDPDYFKLPNVFVMILIAFGMTLTAMCVYVPWKVPYHWLGFIGHIAWYLAYARPQVIRAIWYMAVTIHVSEAIYAYYLAGQKGITGTARFMWFIFTLAFGIGSLINLLKYDPDIASAESVDSLLNELDFDKKHVIILEVNGGDIKKLVI